MGRWRGMGLLLQTLLCWTLLEYCYAGPRPHQRWERPRYPRHPYRWIQGGQNPAQHDQGSQRIEYPSVNDDGGQWLRDPSPYDRGQKVYPSLNDNDGSGHIQVNSYEEFVVVKLFPLEVLLNNVWVQKGRVRAVVLIVNDSPHDSGSSQQVLTCCAQGGRRRFNNCIWSKFKSELKAKMAKKWGLFKLFT